MVDYDRRREVPRDFKEANVSQHVAIIRTAVRETDDFLHLLILSPYFQSFVFDEQTGAACWRQSVAFRPAASTMRRQTSIGAASTQLVLGFVSDSSQWVASEVRTSHFNSQT